MSNGLPGCSTTDRNTSSFSRFMPDNRRLRRCVEDYVESTPSMSMHISRHSCKDTESPTALRSMSEEAPKNKSVTRLYGYRVQYRFTRSQRLRLESENMSMKKISSHVKYQFHCVQVSPNNVAFRVFGLQGTQTEQSEILPVQARLYIVMAAVDRLRTDGDYAIRIIKLLFLQDS